MRLLAGLLMAVAAFGAAPSLDELDALDGLGGVAVSPDGAQVAYTLTQGRPGERSTGIWVVPSSAIYATDPDDQGDWFDDNKPYRHPTFYEIPEEVGHM